VSFKQQIKLFEMYVDSVRGFKERYYVIKPMTDAARESLYHMVEETENGVTVSSVDLGSRWLGRMNILRTQLIPTL
jgi:hypothetical protein